MATRIKKQKTKRQQKSIKNVKKGGNCCNCGKASVYGGTPFGPASYSKFDTQNKYHYPVNNYLKDPTHMQISARNLPNIKGGKRKQNSKTKKRRTKGGSGINGFFSVGQQYENPMSQMFSTEGAQSSANLLMGKNINQISSSPYVQPVTGYNTANPPLI